MTEYDAGAGVPLWLRWHQFKAWFHRCPECKHRPDRHYKSPGPRWEDDKIAHMLGIGQFGCRRCGYGSVAERDAVAASHEAYGVELDRRMAAERTLAAVLEVVETYESCGPKQQSTRDVLAAVRDALTRPTSPARCSTCDGLMTDPPCSKSPDGSVSGHTADGCGPYAQTTPLPPADRSGS